MNMDARIKTIAAPMFGCHSDLDKYKTTPRPECNYHPYLEEKACEGCHRKKDEDHE